jgi:hypothetical protein
MVTVRSEQYPQLVVSDLGLRFRNGEAEVADERALERLRRIAHLGVVVPDAPVKRKPGRPRKAESE